MWVSKRGTFSAARPTPGTGSLLRRRPDCYVRTPQHRCFACSLAYHWQTNWPRAILTGHGPNGTVGAAPPLPVASIRIKVIRLFEDSSLQLNNNSASLTHVMPFSLFAYLRAALMSRIRLIFFKFTPKQCLYY